MSEINVLLIGAGWIAEMVYVPFLEAIHHVNNIYVLDLSIEETTKRFSQYSKVKAVGYEACQNLHYDILFILTPNYLHLNNLLRFARKGTKVLIEKPICISSQELNEFREFCRIMDSKIYVSSPLRYRQDFNDIKKIILSGSLDKIYRVEISWIKRRGTPGSAWFTDKNKSGGGVLIDMGPHLLDLFYWLFGKNIVKHYLGCNSSFFLQSGNAYAEWHRNKENNQEIDVEDSSFSLMIFDNMSLALNLAWASNVENDFTHLKVFGLNAVLEVYTSTGFSTNMLYKNTHVRICSSSKVTKKTVKIEDRKEPFRKMLFDITSNREPDLPNPELAIHIMDNVFNTYKHSINIR